MAFRADVVVMTQACDLEHDKVSNVVVCPHLSLTEYKSLWEAGMTATSQTPSQKAWKSHCNDVRDGLIWNLSILNSLNDSAINMDLRIVEFHEVYTAPRLFLESLLDRRQQPWLRLSPPYREHLSQAFARFFMRVGLPLPIKAMFSLRRWDEILSNGRFRSNLLPLRGRNEDRLNCGVYCLLDDAHGGEVESRVVSIPKVLHTSRELPCENEVPR